MADSTPFKTYGPIRRLRIAEEKTRLLLNTLEQSLSSIDCQRQATYPVQPYDIIQMAAERINAIIKFDLGAVYYVDQRTSTLERACCFPSPLQEELETQFEALIRDGYVAWALREQRGIIIYSNDKRNCVLLHVMATCVRIRGLLVGLFPVHSKRLPDGSLQTLSLLLRNTANALESTEYLGMFHRQCTEMQTKVDQRVAALRQGDLQLLNAQKVESIVTLAGGVAHQFNNALSVLVGNLDLMRLEIAKGKDLSISFERIEAVSQKMQDLTNKLLAYARGGKYKSEKISVEKIVMKALMGIGNSAENSFELELALPADTYFVKVDTTQMQLAIKAIVGNAIDAIEIGGRIVISAEKASIGEATPGPQTDLAPGDYVVLRITDNGKGMDESTRQRIFDPYFTTKFPGRGLGMAAAYGIVKNHHGEILIESEVGQGTSVMVYLPLAI